MTRISRGVALLPLLLLAAFAVAVPAAAQSAPAISASPTSAPNIWTITGSGFEPGVTLRVMALRCPSVTNCAPEGGQSLEGGPTGHIFAPVTPSSSGTFAVDLDFAGAPTPPGASSFVVVAFPGRRAREAADPLTTVPLSAATTPTPAAPTVGTGLRARPEGGAESMLPAALAATVALAGAAFALRRKI